MSGPLELAKSWLAAYSELMGAWARKSGQRADAEDAVQDCMLGLLERGAGQVDDPRAYLRRSASNKLIDGHRRRGLLTAVPFDEASAGQALVEPAATPERLAGQNQLTDALHAALMELPLNCRQAFLWNRIEGRTQQEIAQALGLSVSMVEKYQKRTMAHLHDRLRDRILP